MQHLWWGNYGISALGVVLDGLFAGRKAKLKYIEKSVLCGRKLTESAYKEGQEEVAVFEMKQRTKLLEKSGLRTSPM